MRVEFEDALVDTLEESIEREATNQSKQSQGGITSFRLGRGFVAIGKEGRGEDVPS